MKTPDHQKRNRKPKKRFIVTKDGVDCGYASKRELGLALVLQSGHEMKANHVGARGYLVKKPDAPAILPGEKTALRQIEITERIANVSRGTLVDEMPKIQPLVERGKFEIRHIFQ